MPFWWRRRNKPWYYRRQNYRKRRRRYRTYRKPRRRYNKRRRTRRTYRRRKRRNKVRRKRKTIPLLQWQPDSIVNCKIKGGGAFILGATGRQYVCYTTVKEDYAPPKAPAGGGFAVERFSLQYLYEEWVFRRNIWTKTNILKDLCRYLYCRFTFYRHPETDFIVSYERQPPFDLTKDTYPLTHPQQQLLSRHKKLILSKFTNPTGKRKIRFKVRPPKQMITKWFFTHHFCTAPLLLLRGAAANFSYSNISPSAVNNQISIYFLNLNFYKNVNWGNEGIPTSPYLPYPQIANPLYIKYKKGNNIVTESINKPSDYASSVTYSQGYFQPRLLQAIATGSQATQLGQGALPINVCRYNPIADSGEQNAIWLCATVNNNTDPPTTDKVLIDKGRPLWLMLYGFFSYVLTVKKDKQFLDQHYLVMQSPSLYFLPGVVKNSKVIPIDLNFINGNAPYNEYLTDFMKNHWYPTIKHQVETINAIVEVGPYIPKLSNMKNSTWELNYFYQFHFKWGGPEITDQEVENPSHLPEYTVPDTLHGTVQVSNPSKQIPASYLHAWDYRRGIVTQRALKRIYKHIETDTEFEPETETPKKKKRVTAALPDPEEETQEMQRCLLSLYEEGTSPEQAPENLQQLIQQQQEYNNNLKYNILKLLADLKTKQRMLQLQTGILE
nr:MAG: ORF1 [Torque teno midi virus]